MASTPGINLALDVSIDLIFACAWGLRNTLIMRASFGTKSPV